MDSGNAYIYTGGTAPAEQVNLATGAVTYLVTDSLGSVRGVVSSTGTLTATTSYDAWGNPETTGGLTASTPYGYAGGYTDLDGLIYVLARYYDPAAGQFLSEDPALSQTLQPYAYANGNPVSNTDPTGTNVYATVHGMNLDIGGGYIYWWWTGREASILRRNWTAAEWWAVGTAVCSAIGYLIRGWSGAAIAAAGCSLVLSIVSANLFLAGSYNYKEQIVVMQYGWRTTWWGFHLPYCRQVSDTIYWLSGMSVQIPSPKLVIRSS
jgi:RHS repeat-associated protein